MAYYTASINLILTTARALELVESCPVCGNRVFDPFLVCEDYLVSHKEFAIQQCRQCSFRLTNPRPDSSSVGSYYKSDQYISHNDKSGGLVNSVYRLVRNYTLQSKLKLINTLNKGAGSILDVGCGTGAFLETCKVGGWTVTGMEPDLDVSALASKKLNAHVHTSLDTLVGHSQFDIITLWHVLEHIATLNEAIDQLRQLTSDKGTLLIAVPNSNSYDATYFKQYWAAYDAPRHLHHFVPSTIQTLFDKHGFVLVGKKPMMFDAFYITMLSLNYQNKSDYLKSVKIGLKSNAEGKRTGNYSSMIYIFKKK